MSTASGALAQQADLVIAKSGPASAAANSNVAYTLNVVNLGPDDAAAATVSDPIPAGMTFVSLSSPVGWSCTTPVVGGTGTVTCVDPTFAAGASANFTLTVFIPPATPPGTAFTNIATVSSTTFDPNTENNSSPATTFVAGGTSADLTLSKTAPAAVSAGQNIVYSMPVVNNGPDSASSVSLTDPLPGTATFVSLSSPAGWTCTTPAVGGGGTISCSIATLASGAGGTFTLTVNVPAGTPDGTLFTNTATISSTTADPTPENNSATAGTTVITPAPDLTIAKSHSGNAAQGQVGFAYTITVSNVGTGPTSGTVTVSDTVPAGLTATAISGSGWSCTAGATSTCTRSDALGPGGSYPPITLTVNVASNAPAIVSNTASVSGGGDTNAANNSATDPTIVGPPGAADLAIAKTHAGEARAGQAGFNYTITVNNAGTAASGGAVTVTDILPPKLTATAISGAGWACSLGATPSCTRSDALAPGATYPVITLTVKVAGDAPATVTNTATVSGGGDTNPANNTATDQTTVRARADPTKDPDVVGLVNAQVATAQRFATTQISNFNERLEALHDDSTGDQFGLRFGSPEQDSCTVPGINVPLDPRCRKQVSEASATDAFAYAPNGKPVYKAEPPKPKTTWRDYAFWSTGYVSFGSADQTAQRSAIDFNTSGVSAGVDYRLGRNLIAGLGVGYGRDSTRIGDKGTRSGAEVVNVAGYGSYRPFANFFIDGLAGYGAMRFNSQRFAVDDAAFVYGARNGSQVFGSLTAAYQYRWQTMMLSPYARINAAWITLGAFTETGGSGGALAYSSQSADFYTSVLGLRGKYVFLTDWGSIAPRFRVEYNHDFAGASTIFLQYADLVGPVYSLTTAPLGRDRATFGAGTDLVIGGAHRIALDYQYDADFVGTAWHRFKVRWDTRF